MEANKLAHEINRTFIQADRDPIIVKHQNITVAMEKVALTMLTKHVQKFRESANTDTSSERQKKDTKSPGKQNDEKLPPVWQKVWYKRIG